jgi:hypothetical protein
VGRFISLYREKVNIPTRKASPLLSVGHTVIGSSYIYIYDLAIGSIAISNPTALETKREPK